MNVMIIQSSYMNSNNKSSSPYKRDVLNCLYQTEIIQRCFEIVEKEVQILGSVFILTTNQLLSSGNVPSLQTGSICIQIRTEDPV